MNVEGEVYRIHVVKIIKQKCGGGVYRIVKVINNVFLVLYKNSLGNLHSPLLPPYP